MKIWVYIFSLLGEINEKVGCKLFDKYNYAELYH